MGQMTRTGRGTERLEDAVTSHGRRFGALFDSFEDGRIAELEASDILVV